MSFEEQFEKSQLEIKHRKMYYSIKRAMNIQARNKIKPSSMNPVLLNSPMEGGIRVTDEPLDLYYPSSSNLTGGGYWTDRFNEHAFKTNASPEAIKRVGDELKAAMRDLPPSRLTLGFDTRKHKLLVDAYERLRQIVRQEAEQKKKEDSYSQVFKVLPPIGPPPSRRRQYMDQQAQQAQRPASGVGF